MWMDDWKQLINKCWPQLGRGEHLLPVHPSGSAHSVPQLSAFNLKWVCCSVTVYHYASFPATSNTLGSIPSKEKRKKYLCQHYIYRGVANALGLSYTISEIQLEIQKYLEILNSKLHNFLCFFVYIFTLVRGNTCSATWRISQPLH